MYSFSKTTIVFDKTLKVGNQQTLQDIIYPIPPNSQQPQSMLGRYVGIQEEQQSYSLIIRYINIKQKYISKG